MPIASVIARANRSAQFWIDGKTTRVVATRRARVCIEVFEHLLRALGKISTRRMASSAIAKLRSRPLNRDDPLPGLILRSSGAGAGRLS
jgi:hypothetical protein